MLCRRIRIGTIILVLLLIAGCSSGDFTDLREFMAEVEQRPKGKIAPLPAFEAYQAFGYGAQSLRSPFVPPIVLPPKTDVQMENIGVKPPPNHVKQFLEKFSIASLVMVGTLSKEDSIWALIKDSEGGVHRVQIGDYMGTNFGKVESIDDARIDITEIISDGQGGWLRRPRTIALRMVEDA